MDRGLLPSTTYYYVAEAINGYGSSGPSNEASATTGVQPLVIITPPTAPTGLSVELIGNVIAEFYVETVFPQ
jgi:hypothetical protein